MLFLKKSTSAVFLGSHDSSITVDASLVGRKGAWRGQRVICSLIQIMIHRREAEK